MRRDTSWGGAGGFACRLIVAEYRRKLPHFHPDGAWLFITWRLWRSLPPAPDPILYSSPGRAFMARDRLLDHATGPKWLHDHRIADLVAECILIGDRERQFL